MREGMHVYSVVSCVLQYNVGMAQVVHLPLPELHLPHLQGLPVDHEHQVGVVQPGNLVGHLISQEHSVKDGRGVRHLSICADDSLQVWK